MTTLETSLTATNELESNRWHLLQRGCTLYLSAKPYLYGKEQWGELYTTRRKKITCVHKLSVVTIVVRVVIRIIGSYYLKSQNRSGLLQNHLYNGIKVELQTGLWNRVSQFQKILPTIFFLFYFLGVYEKKTQKNMEWRDTNNLNE